MQTRSKSPQQTKDHDRLSIFPRATHTAWLLFLMGIAYVWQARLTETPDVYAPHAAIGGSGAVLLLYPAALIVTLLVIYGFPEDSTELTKAKPKAFWNQLIVVFLPFILVALCHLTLERHSLRFTDSRFKQITTQFQQPEVTVYQEDVLALLGKPVDYKHGFSPGGEKWSYTYMPSTGWGFRVRIIEFDANGHMINFLQHDEP